jgi:hypothetical protein
MEENNTQQINVSTQSKLPLRITIAASFMILAGVITITIPIILAIKMAFGIWVFGGGEIYSLVGLVSLIVGILILTKKKERGIKITIRILFIEIILLLLFLGNLLFHLISSLMSGQLSVNPMNEILNGAGLFFGLLFLPLFLILVPLSLLLSGWKRNLSIIGLILCILLSSLCFVQANKQNDDLNKISDEQSIRIISPNGGENIVLGSIFYDTNWSFVGDTYHSDNYYIKLSLEKGTVILGSINRNPLSTDSTSYDWGQIGLKGVGNYIDSDGNVKTAIAGNDYKIREEVYQMGSFVPISQGESDNFFSLTGNSTQYENTTVKNEGWKPIAVIFPNGGENLIASNTYTISWSAYSKIKSVVIALMEGNSREYLINKSIDASLGKFSWKFDGSSDYIGKDNLKIVLYDAAFCKYVNESMGVECVKDGLSHGDASDGYFSIQIK